MFQLITKIRQKNDFIPCQAGLFFNTTYLMRRGLAEAIGREAGRISGIVLDFGCGSKPYESLFKADQYIGLDIEVSGHPVGSKKPDIYYDGKHIPLDDASVDCVFAAEVFEHIFNAEELYAEIMRVIKPGGTFLLTCPFVWPLHEEPYDYARYTPYALQAELGKAGFKSIEIQRQGHTVEVVSQMLHNYFQCKFIPQIRFISGFFSLIYCAYFNISARLMARILPTDTSLYLSNIVVARKPLP